MWSLGSAAGGLAYGARPRRRPLARVHLTVALLLPAFLAPLVLAGSPFAMGLLLVPAGIFIAPLIATRNELAGDVRSGSMRRVAAAVGEGSTAVRLVHEHLAELDERAMGSRPV